MTYDIRLAIHLLVPEAQYGGAIEFNTKEEFDALRWEDPRPMPSWDAVVAMHAKEVPAFNLKQELADLDGVYSRADEERDAKMGYAPYAGDPANGKPASAQAVAKARKLELRAQLAAL